MNLKDKLDLIWKFLFLLVIVYGIYSFTYGTKHHRCSRAYGMKSDHHWCSKEYGKHKMMFDADDMDIRVEKKIIDGDTTVVIFMDGEEVEVKEFDEDTGWHVIKTKDGKIIKLKGDKIHKKVRMKMKH
jgi:hypothetical protein